MSLILINPSIVINSVDLSSYCDQVTLQETYADVDLSVFGNQAKQRGAGLKDNKFTVDFLNDFGLATVEATVYPLLGLTTQIAIKPVKAATSTTNPAYTFTVVVLDWKPLDTKIGEAVKVSVTWPITGDVVKAFS